jgi:hypothetical protein
VVVGESHVLDGERSAVAGNGPAAGLREAVRRMRRELTAHPPLAPDRTVAEDALEELAGQAETAERALGLVDCERVRHSLLLVAAALGSISALAAPLDELREAVERLVPPHP